MRLTIRLLGCDVLDVDLSDSPSPEPDEDTARDLSGGTLATAMLDDGPTDCYLGFTNGRGDDE